MKWKGNADMSMHMHTGVHPDTAVQTPLRKWRCWRWRCLDKGMSVSMWLLFACA
jgi:hypothetical protein